VFAGFLLKQESADMRRKESGGMFAGGENVNHKELVKLLKIIIY